MKDNFMNALVVDDNEVNTLVLTHMLELFDIEVDQANSGMKALEMVYAKEYDVIFIDHVMPGKDGIQTTKAIREYSFHNKQIIIALTSSITDTIRKQYQQVGANEVCSKPMGLIELSAILKQWCPRLLIQEITGAEQVVDKQEEASLIKRLLSEISEINYEVGLRYAMGDPINYINILKVSLKDIKTCSNLIFRGYANNQPKDMQIGAHNMKSVFANIGAMELVDIAREFEQTVLKTEIVTLKLSEHPFVKDVENIYDKLKTVIEQYDTINKELLHEELPNHPLTIEEYEQSLEKVIYYIKRFDYAAILELLELLIRQGLPECKTVMEHALAHIKDFQYEEALLLLTDIKKEMDRRAISTNINYSLQ